MITPETEKQHPAGQTGEHPGPAPASQPGRKNNSAPAETPVRRRRGAAAAESTDNLTYAIAAEEPAQDGIPKLVKVFKERCDAEFEALNTGKPLIAMQRLWPKKVKNENGRYEIMSETTPDK